MNNILQGSVEVQFHVRIPVTSPDALRVIFRHLAKRCGILPAPRTSFAHERATKLIVLYILPTLVTHVQQNQLRVLAINVN